jgi:ferritin-like metal-binding protein YciE
MADKTMNERDAKLVQWLGEAYAKEAELETDLQAHITLTDKMSYKKRLRQHLTETRDHKRRVASRIKKLGGSPTTAPNVPAVPSVVGEVAGKAVAAVKGQVGTARALITQQAETHLRNAQEELREEHVEIALYTRIETLATEVGDKETAQLARSIRRDEERMAKFLDAELVRLVKEVVRAEIPKDQRTTARRRSSTSRKSSSSRKSTSSRTSGSSRKSASSGKSTSSRKSTSARKSTSSRKRSTSSSNGASASSRRSRSRKRTTARSS